MTSLYRGSTVYEQEPPYNETSIANKFCQSLGPSLNRGSTVFPNFTTIPFDYPFVCFND